MSEYIKREDALTLVIEDSICPLPFFCLIEAVSNLPAADVAEVRRGQWIMRGGKLHCSNCDNLASLKRGWEDGCTTYDYTASGWCPNCGAKMDLEED